MKAVYVLGASLVAQTVKKPPAMQETQVRSLGQEDPLEKGMAIHSQVALMVKSLPAKAGDIRDAGLIPGSGRSSGGGHGNPLQYSFLENPTDRGARRATVYRVTKSQTQLKQLSMQIYVLASNYKTIFSLTNPSSKRTNEMG